MKITQQSKRPGCSGGSNPGQAGTGQNTATWKYKPGKKRITLSNWEFIAHAFCRSTPDEVPWVTGFAGDPVKVEHRMWFGQPALPLPAFIRDTGNNYVVVSSFRRADDGRFRRRKACFSGMFVVMVDDVGTKVPFSKLRIEPTCLVETSPGNYQAWYFLNEPERDRGRAESLIKGMIASGLTADGSDPGMNGVTRYGRLPVGVNGKAKYANDTGQPFVQRVAHWAPHVRYSLDAIAAAYGVALGQTQTTMHRSKRKAAKAVATPGDNQLIAILEAADLYLEPLDSISGGHRIVCPWVHEHTDADITGTVYFEESEENSWAGGFKCQHGHCQHRTIADLTHFITRLLQKNKEH